jgi:hypothetical protein
MTPRLGLACFETPLKAQWQSLVIASFTASEQARLARIERPLRREQFVIGHQMLRWVLAAAGLDNVPVEIAANGAPRPACMPPVYASIAHSGTTVAVVVAGEPVGIDVETTRALRDPRAAAALLGLPLEGDDSDSVLRAWVLNEAQYKLGSVMPGHAWSASWESCQLAVIGVVNPPLSGVFEIATGNYNLAELRWQRHDCVADRM